ncbi:hypothetical protein [Allomesorhizobium camelthorni]|nr:hypothetical protein [Mesorhizobium camelthorni]
MDAITLSGRMASMDISPVAAELDARIGLETVNFVMSAFGKRIL